MADTKTCKSCESSLPYDQFTVDNRSRDGYSVYCNQCKAFKFDLKRDRYIASSDDLKARLTYIIFDPETPRREVIMAVKELANLLHLYNLTDSEKSSQFAGLSNDELKTLVATVLHTNAGIQGKQAE